MGQGTDLNAVVRSDMKKARSCFCALRFERYDRMNSN